MPVCAPVYEKDATPPGLIEFIGEGYDEQFRASLGPNRSYFAWTSKRIRWQGIPAGLEKRVQSWLSPSGWKAGPPRIVALGPEGSYFALSEYGACARSFSDALIAKYPGIKLLDGDVRKNRSHLEVFEVYMAQLDDNGNDDADFESRSCASAAQFQVTSFL